MPKKPKVMSAKDQPTLFDLADENGVERKDTTSTFSDNLGLAVHRWFRYSAGFSAVWVRELIEREKVKGRSRVLDPFAGSGTVALECERCQVKHRAGSSPLCCPHREGKTELA